VSTGSGANLGLLDLDRAASDSTHEQETMAPNESAVSELAAWRDSCASTRRDRAEVRSEGRRTGAPEPETGTVRRCQRAHGNEQVASPYSIT